MVSVAGIARCCVSSPCSSQFPMCFERELDPGAGAANHMQLVDVAGICSRKGGSNPKIATEEGRARHCMCTKNLKCTLKRCWKLLYLQCGSRSSLLLIMAAMLEFTRACANPPMVVKGSDYVDACHLLQTLAPQYTPNCLWLPKIILPSFHLEVYVHQMIDSRFGRNGVHL